MFTKNLSVKRCMLRKNTVYKVAYFYIRRLIFLKSCYLFLILLGVFFHPQSTTAASITQTYGVFDITFYNMGDSDDYLTGQGSWTAQQIEDVVSSISAWASHISNIPGRQIQMHVFWSELDSYGNNVLGGSSSYRIADGTTIWNLGEYVWKEKLNPGISHYGFDTVLQYDITAGGLSWNFGSGMPSDGQVDFRSAVTHEIGHSLGWNSSYDSIYDDWGWFGNKYYGLTAWDKNFIDSAGNRPQSGSVGTPGNFNQTDNPIYFDGANAVALYGEPVPVYAPSTYSDGSSLVHLDETALGSLLMSPFIVPGQMTRSVSELEWAMMKDMNWIIVPEPMSILFFILSAVSIFKKNKQEV